MNNDIASGFIQPIKNTTDWTHVRLAPLEEFDADLLYVWQNSSNIRDWTMGFRFPVQKEEVKEWIKKQREHNAKSRVVFAIRQKQDFVGTIQLNSMDQYQRKALLGVYIGESNKRNTGLGFISCSLLIDYAFNGLDMRKLGLEVLSINQKAVNLFEKLGFQKEGTKVKEYFLDGQYLNVCIYGLQRADWKTNIPPTANRLIGAVYG